MKRFLGFGLGLGEGVVVVVGVGEGVGRVADSARAVTIFQSLPARTEREHTGVENVGRRTLVVYYLVIRSRR